MPPPPHCVRGRIKQNRSRDALTRPSFVHHHHAKESLLPVTETGKRSAERRMPTMSALRKRVNASAPLICTAAARPLREARPPFGAHACGTRHRLSPRWLSSRTGFPRRCDCAVFCRQATTLRRVKHAPCGPVFVPVDRGPRAARERMANPPRGHRPSLRLNGLPFRKGALR